MSTAPWDNRPLDLWPLWGKGRVNLMLRSSTAIVWEAVDPLWVQTKEGVGGWSVTTSAHQFVCHLLPPPRSVSTSDKQPTQGRWRSFHLSADPAFTLQTVTHPARPFNSGVRCTVPLTDPQQQPGRCWHQQTEITEMNRNTRPNKAWRWAGTAVSKKSSRFF